MSYFNCFFREVELDDVNVLRRQYTWYHPNGGMFPFGCSQEMCLIIVLWW